MLSVIGLGGVGVVLGMSGDQMNRSSWWVMNLGCVAPLAMAGWLAWRWYSA